MAIPTATPTSATPTRGPAGLPDELGRLLADDDALVAAVEAAEMPALLPALAHLTGDLGLVDDTLRPPLRLLPDRVEPQGGMSPEVVAQARARAVAALRALRDGRTAPAPEPDTATLRRLMRFVAGDVGDEYLPLMAHELGLPDDAGAPTWTVDEMAPGRTLDVVVIGAGMSGLVTAHRLTQAGVRVAVCERNDDVGGVWLENGYPGARLDTANFAYSYSFAQRPDWPHQFSARDDIHDYFRSVADELDLRRLVRFGTEVTAAEFDETTARWTVTTRDRTGSEATLTADAVVSATGQLNRPKLPDVPGRETFAGPAFHTARWRHDVDLTRPAGRGRRDRRERVPGRAVDRRPRRVPDGLPAHAAVDGADADLPRAHPGPGPDAGPRGAALPALVAVPAVLDLRRRPAAVHGGRSGVGAPGVGVRGQRGAASRARGQPRGTLR